MNRKYATFPPIKVHKAETNKAETKSRNWHPRDAGWYLLSCGQKHAVRYEACGIVFMVAYLQLLVYVSFLEIEPTNITRKYYKKNCISGG